MGELHRKLCTKQVSPLGYPCRSFLDLLNRESSPHLSPQWPRRIKRDCCMVLPWLQKQNQFCCLDTDAISQLCCTMDICSFYTTPCQLAVSDRGLLVIEGCSFLGVRDSGLMGSCPQCGRAAALLQFLVAEPNQHGFLCILSWKTRSIIKETWPRVSSPFLKKKELCTKVFMLMNCICGGNELMSSHCCRVAVEWPASGNLNKTHNWVPSPLFPRLQGRQTEATSMGSSMGCGRAPTPSI